MKTVLILVLALFVFLFPLLSVQAENTVPASGLYAYETVEGMKVGAAFGILPEVTENDELVSVTSPISSRIEIHEMKDVNGIMQMRKVDSMPVVKDAENTLDPMGYHLMLMDLKEPLKKGTEFPITLAFKKAGEKIVTIPVLARKAK